jgi:Baseplate J-like protein
VNVPELLLDDLTWDDLVERGRRAIPAASEGRWTLHAPVDPGVTLLELFAAELEQRLFTLDRVPDTLVRAVMRLLLGEGAGPRPAQAAVAVMRLLPGDAAVDLPAGSPLRQAADDRLVLTTEHGVLAVPSAEVTRLEVDGTDLLPRLRAGEPVAVFGADGRDEALLELTAATPATEHRLYVAVEDPTVATGWQPGTAPPSRPSLLAATPARGLGWVADDGSAVFLDGDGQQIPAGDLGALALTGGRHRPRWEALVGDRVWPLRVNDGTGGLRVSGLVRLRPPPGRTFPATVRLRIAKPSPEVPLHPLVSALVANAVVARHRRLVDREDVAGEPVLALPHRELDLADAAPHTDRPLDRVLDGPGLASLTVRHPDGAEETFSAVPDLAFSQPGDRHMRVDRERGVLRFGDGRGGRIPRWERDASARLRYWVGAGVPPEVGTEVDFLDPSGLAARTVTRLRWGREPEGPEAARARAAQALSRSTRAVTAADLEAVVRAVPGVRLARVHVQPGLDPGHPGAAVPDAVTMVCVPAVQRRGPEDLRAVPAPEPDHGSLAAVAAALDRARLVGARVFVRGPAWRRVEVDAELVVLATDAAALLRRAEGALRHFLDPLVGGPRAAGWPFGGAVLPADLSALLQRILGRQGEVRELRVREPDGTPTNCEPLPLRPSELPRLVRVALTRAPGGAGRK